MDEDLAAAVAARLRERNQTLATAESLTGGLLGELLTAVPGVSAVYRGGVIAYATEIKESVLGVGAATLRRSGAVSAECAAEMAAGVRRLLGSDWAVSTTGVAGPDRQEGKAVGTVYLAVAGPGRAGPAVRELSLDGDRERIRRSAGQEALRFLLDTVG